MCVTHPRHSKRSFSDTSAKAYTFGFALQVLCGGLAV